MIIDNNKLNNKEFCCTICNDTEQVAVQTEYGEYEIEEKQIKVRLTEIADMKTNAHSDFSDITKREVLFKERLHEKYGEGEIDVQFGVYIKK